MKIALKKISLLFLFLFNGFIVLAQLPTSGLIPVGLKSPDAAILEKFGNIPVGYSTGVPNVSIPLYEIKLGKIDIPISLDYHGSGIKVNDISSSVGIGWALNAGGIVSRNMVGRPDETYAYGYLAVPSETAIFNNPGHNYQYLYNFLGTSDYGPDIFSYSIEGESGKFLFNKDQSVFQIPVSDNVIQAAIVPNSITNFKITDANGVDYIFDLPETVDMTDIPLTYTSSWRLTKIIDQNKKDTVFLTYDSGSGLEYAHDDIASFVSMPSCQSVVPTSTNTTLNTTTTAISHPTEYYLNAITWRGGKISFTNVKDRQDRILEPRLSEIDIFSNVNQNLQKIKTVKLSQSYFFNNSTAGMPFPYPNSDPRNYRLRLDAVGFYSADGTGQPSYYNMTYDPNPMASSEATGQDMWGYNNGHNENPSLLASELVYDYTGKTYAVGNAIRNPDTVFVHACSLQSIQYPTGGKSVFVMEPHQYSDPTAMVPGSIGCGVITGSGPTTYSTNFTLPVGYSNLSYNVNFSSFNYTTQIPQPSITITDQSTGIQQVVYSPNNAQPYSSGTLYIYPTGGQQVFITGGHTYTITAYIGSNTSNSGPVEAMITFNWNQSAPSVKIGGGLRVKSITNYDNNGNFLNEDIYKYGIGGEEGYGKLMTPPFLLNFNNNTTHTIYRIYCTSPPILDGYTSYTYHSNTLNAVSQIGSSPVLYPAVTKYQISSSGGKTNGKAIYNYQMSTDTIVGFNTLGPMVMSNDWQSNILLEERTFKSVNGGTSFNPLVDKKYSYLVDRAHSKTQLQITGNYTYLNQSAWQDSSDVTNTFGGYYAPDFSFALYPNPSGIVRLHNTTTTNYFDNGQTATTVENRYYGDTTHLFPTRIQTFSSKNETLTDSMRYAHDFALPGNVYTTMMNRNIKAPVVQSLKYRNTIQESSIKANYADWYGNNALLVPLSVDEQIMANPVETRVKFNKYDSYGNIIQQQKTNGPYQSYIWDYNKSYPIAEVKNADSVSIAYTSFEADGTGNWTVGSANRVPGGLTGNQSYSLSNGAISKSGLTSTQTYVVSYWTSSGSPLTITGTLSGYPIKGATLNGWTYYEHHVTGQTTISVSGTALIDELRLYPLNALMTTFTYNPLIGISSAANEKSQITYYEYDSFQRLINIKDQNGNIIKSFCYNYAGQSYGCNVGPVVPPVQTYPFTLTNSTGVSGFVASFTAGTINYSFNFLTTGSTTVQIPPGSYTLVINPINAPTNRKFLLGSRAPVTAPGTTFTGVVVSATGTETPIIIEQP